MSIGTDQFRNAFHQGIASIPVFNHTVSKKIPSRESLAEPLLFISDMKKRIHRFLRALLSLFYTKKDPPKDFPFKHTTYTMTQSQCIHFINSVGKILKEEAAKKDMQVNIHIVPKTSSGETVGPETTLVPPGRDHSTTGKQTDYHYDNGSP